MINDVMGEKERQESCTAANVPPLQIERSEQDENPWIKYFGMFKDNPVFDEVLEEIERYRRELDAEEQAKWETWETSEQPDLR